MTSHDESTVVPQNATVSSVGSVSRSGYEITMGVAITAANLLLLLVYALRKKIRENIRLPVLNLAVVDLQNGSLMIPLGVAIPYPARQHLAGSTCAFITCYYHWVPLVAHFGHLLVTIDRFVGICKPFEHSNIMSLKNSAIYLGFLWLVSILFGFGPALGIPRNPSVIYTTGCKDHYVAGTDYIFLQLILYQGIVAVELVLYVWMFCVAKQHARKIARLEVSAPGMSEQARQTNRRWVKAAVTTVLTTSLFVVCWVPFITIHSVLSVCRRTMLCRVSHDDVNTATVVFGGLVKLQPLINPLLFAFRDRQIRHELVKMFFFWRGRDKVEDTLGMRTSTASTHPSPAEAATNKRDNVM